MNTPLTPFRSLMLFAFVAALIASPLALSPVMGDDDDSPIIQQMDKVNLGYKLLRRQARSLSFDDESLDLIIGMQTSSLAAMHESFPIADEAPAAAKAKIILGYKKQMAMVVNVLLDMEIALIEGRKEDVAKGLEKLGSLKSDGHDEYTED